MDCYSEIVGKINKLCKDKSLSFSRIANLIITGVNSYSENELLEHLDYAGIIPECFGHDSTEEKVYAKYCDALLARAFIDLGLDAKALEERTDAADVHAKGSKYDLVGDAKAFRLSRTAKNQKDFKVEALNQWRHGADFACLSGPLYQFPSSRSQIYEQAIRYNVTLISYTHLTFLLRSKAVLADDLKELFAIGTHLEPDQSASSYWTAVLDVLLKITHKKANDWNRALKETYERLREPAAQQVKYWEEEKKRIRALNHNVAVRELIQALKINEKIEVIRRTSGI